MDDPFDAYKGWLKDLQKDKSTSIPFMFLHMCICIVYHLSTFIYINYTLSNMFLVLTDLKDEFKDATINTYKEG